MRPGRRHDQQRVLACYRRGLAQPTLRRAPATYDDLCAVPDHLVAEPGVVSQVLAGTQLSLCTTRGERTSPSASREASPDYCVKDSLSLSTASYQYAWVGEMKPPPTWASCNWMLSQLLMRARQRAGKSVAAQAMSAQASQMAA